MSNGANIVTLIQNILIYIILSIEIVNKNMTIGDFSMFLSAAGSLYSFIIGLTGSYSSLMLESGWYLRDLRRCMDISKQNGEDDGIICIEKEQNAEIQFKNVSFKYPNTDQMILKK